MRCTEAELNFLTGKAGKLAIDYKDKGYHCSEAVIRAVSEVLEIPLSADTLRAACGFFGGGGGIGGRCGIFEVGVMLFSILYGRANRLTSEEPMKKLIPYWEKCFLECFQSTECREIKPRAVEKYSAMLGCRENYGIGTACLVKALLRAEEVLREEEQQ